MFDTTYGAGHPCLIRLTKLKRGERHSFNFTLFVAREELPPPHLMRRYLVVVALVLAGLQLASAQILDAYR